MKNKLLVLVFGLILSFCNITFAQNGFAQSGANYKQQFKSSQVNELNCDNFSPSSLVNRNYKQTPLVYTKDNWGQVRSGACLKEEVYNKSCCKEDKLSANYKHAPSFVNPKDDCDI
jgi:hypothetical protein